MFKDWIDTLLLIYNQLIHLLAVLAEYLYAQFIIHGFGFQQRIIGIYNDGELHAVFWFIPHIRKASHPHRHYLTAG